MAVDIVNDVPQPAHSPARWWQPVALMVIAKVLLLALVGITFQVQRTMMFHSLHDWLQIWNGWDAPHYLDLARYGYEATGERALFLVFYPLFPWLTRLATPLVGGDYLLGAFLVSTVASLVVAWLLFRLVCLDADPTVAQRAVWFLAIFPTAYFLHIGYTESLSLVFVLGAFLAARTGRWPLVGLLGALACLTRVNGLLLLPALAIEPALQLWRTRQWQWCWLWLAVIPFGFGGYLLLNYQVQGDPFAFLEITRSHWFKQFAPPWQGIAELLKGVSWRPPDEIWTVVWQQLFFLLLDLVAVVASWRWLRPSYTVWLGLNLLLFTSTSFILSVPRYSLLLFPLPILFALLARRQHWWQALTIGSLLLQALLAYMFVMQHGAVF